MNATETKVSVTLDSNFQSVEVAEKFVHSVMDRFRLEEAESHRVEMAVRESVINAIQHGNRCDESKKVELEISLTPAKLTIFVRDEGQGFDPASIANPLEENNILKTSGRGIFIIRSFMDEFSVRRRNNDGSEVMMVKRLSSNSNSNAS
ncbi:MAG: ATP-binding protein [Acidobacteriia bacterium]|nr:ATP-binding protein [Terriglobia bacterium]